MKKTILILALAAAGIWVGKAEAADLGTSLEISPQVGLAQPGQGNFSLGIGAGLFVGARMDDISLGAQTTIYSFNYAPPGTNANVTGGFSMVEFLALLKKRFGGAGPAYFLVNLGAGGALYTDNSSGIIFNNTIKNNISETDPLVKASLGVGFKLSPGSELSFELGPDMAFSNGGRYWIAPFQVGLSFF